MMSDQALALLERVNVSRTRQRPRMPYTFRLQVRFGTPIELPPQGAFLELDGFPRIEVQREAGRSREAGARVTFIAGGFPTEHDARARGEAFANLVRIYAARTGIGADLGTGKATLQFSEAIHDAVRGATGRDLRADVLGLMTYQDDSVGIVGVHMEASTALPFRLIQTGLLNVPRSAVRLSDAQRRCADLISDAAFVGRSEARLVLLVAAVEALCLQPRHSDAPTPDVAQSAADADATAKGAPTPRTKASSVRSAVREKITLLLSPDAAEQFHRISKLRHRLVHAGVGRGTLGEAANEAMRIAVDLLVADVLGTA